MDKRKITLTVLAFSIMFASPAISERPRGRTNDQPNNEISFEQTRTITLDQFGIRMEIAKTDRAMLRNDGTVLVVDESTYATFRCNAIKPGLCYGGGYSSLKIRLLPDSKNSLLEKRVGKRLSSDNCYSPFVSPFSLHNIDGLVSNCASGSSVTAWFYVPNVGVIEMTNSFAGDMTTMRRELMDYLSSIEYLDTPPQTTP